MSEKTDRELIEQIIKNQLSLSSKLNQMNSIMNKQNLIESKFDDLTDQLNKFIKARTPQPEETPIQSFSELSGLPQQIRDIITAKKLGDEIRVYAPWITDKPLLQTLYSSLESIGFGRHVDGKNSYWSNKISIKPKDPDWEEPREAYKFTSSV